MGKLRSIFPPETKLLGRRHFDVLESDSVEGMDFHALPSFVRACSSSTLGFAAKVIAG